MCLPCFPWTWTEYEDPLDSMPEQHVWVHDGQAWSLQRYVSVSFTCRLISSRLFLYCLLLTVILLRCASFLEQRACDSPPFFFPFSHGPTALPQGKELGQSVGRNCEIYSTVDRIKKTNAQLSSDDESELASNASSAPASFTLCPLPFRSNKRTSRPLRTFFSSFFPLSIPLLEIALPLLKCPKLHRISSLPRPPDG